MMRAYNKGWFLLCGLCLSACAPTIFPDKVMQDVQPTFDFATWRDAADPRSTNPAAAKIQIGGRIVGAAQKNGTLIVIGEQLPIVQHPAYGPTDTIKRTGAFEFAFGYKGQLDPSWLTPGNRFIVVGKTKGTEFVQVDGAPKYEPYLVAQCVHIWKTEGREIAAFVSGGVGGGFYPLEHQTFCVG